jgi:hypothetical protein
MSKTLEAMKESRLAKMREGQAGGTVVEFPNKPEIRFILVPLTDGEYLKSLQIAGAADLEANEAGIIARDHIQKQAVIMYAAREMQDWTSMVFSSTAEVGEGLEQHELNYVYDLYLEMVADNSPSLYMLSDEEFDNLKKAWQRIEWNELSGTQQYAAMRFLNSILAGSLADSFFGSPSTSKLTQTTENEIPAESASTRQGDVVMEY